MSHAITDYGGVDGSHATEAFQAAIDACADDGGGTVRVPPGEYEVGSVSLSDHLTVSLAPGAVVSASPDEADYQCPPEYVGPDGERPLVLARNCTGVSITGKGTIRGRGTEITDLDEPLRQHSGQSASVPLVSDGEPRARQGEDFLDPTDGTDEWPVAKPPFRPGPMLCFDGCENVALSGVTFSDAPAWTVSLRNCESVTVGGVTVRNHMRIPNCDGLSVDGSRDVRVSDCSIRCCDDAITLKATEAERACESVAVTNCTLASRACAVKLGSETNGPIRDCVISNCVVRGSNRGLGIQHRDGGDIERIRFRDCTVETRLFDGPWWGKAEPIYVTSVPRDEQTDLGRVAGITVSNVDARCESGVLVYGHTDADIEDVRLEAVHLDVREASEADAVGGNVDLQPTSVEPPIREHDVPAVHCENVDGLVLRDVTVEWADDVPAYHTHGVAGVGLDDVIIDGFDGAPAHSESGDAAVSLRDSSTVTVRDSRARAGTGVFLEAVETSDERLFSGNDLAEAERKIAGGTAFTEFGNVDPQ
ncbi:glycoside hydrolase family 28 protein (plasmid) [Haloarcula salina]|uniref:glycoside hydrolase family 28 protein n=1 Tax=Haloarcula salina TaxID=1429914 RepID=UPI003C6FABF4